MPDSVAGRIQHIEQNAGRRSYRMARKNATWVVIGPNGTGYAKLRRCLHAQAVALARTAFPDEMIKVRYWMKATPSQREQARTLILTPERCRALDIVVAKPEPSSQFPDAIVRRCAI